MKIFKLVIIVFFIHFASCSDELNVTPVDQFSDATVWTDPALVQTFVNGIYSGMPHGFSNIMMAALVDETMYNADFGSSNVTKSLITPSDLSIFEPGFWTANRQRGVEWSRVYKFIRSANLFFDKVEAAPIDEKSKNALKGEVYFLRAYLYHNLVTMYGGVPLITKAYGLEDDFLTPRNTYEECVNFITGDLDKAAALLPLAQTGTNKGRATKGAALALKVRVLLHAASDLYNSKAAWAGSFSNPELVGYVGGDRTARWQAAKAAAKAVIDLGAGYALYAPTPASAQEATNNYADIFLKQETTEDIFVSYFTVKTDQSWDGYNPGLYNNPNGYHGWGSNTPIGQHVDSYELNDGTKFDWNNATHAADLYLNRDPRLYASIQYEGAKWRQRPADVVSRDPVGVIQVGFWEKWNGTAMEVISGLDTRKSPIEDWNGTYTGYFMRKFIDPTIDAQFNKQNQPWRFIRYTEVLLNYAEACIELGQDAEAKTYLNQIRKRASMPEITESGAALKARYRNERRVELAFEDHLYADVRHWMIADVAYLTAKGVEPRYKLQADKSTAKKPTYTVVDAQQRQWNPRFYFLPIKLDEINRNKLLVQNPLY